MKNFAKLLLILPVVSVTGCANFWSKQDNIDNQEWVTNTASFYFNCPAEKITMSCLNFDKNRTKVCSEYGVKACDSKAIYTQVGQSWVMTSSGSAN